MKIKILFLVLTIFIFLNNLEVNAENEEEVNIDEIIQSIDEEFRKLTSSNADSSKIIKINGNIDNHLDKIYKTYGEMSIIASDYIPLLIKYIDTGNEKQTELAYVRLSLFLSMSPHIEKFPYYKPLAYKLSKEEIEILHEKLTPLFNKTFRELPYFLIENIQPAPPNEFLDEILETIRDESAYPKNRVNATRVLGRFRPVTEENKQVLINNMKEHPEGAIIGLIRTIPADSRIISQIIDFTKDPDERIKTITLSYLEDISKIIKKNEDMSKIKNEQGEQWRWIFINSSQMELFKGNEILEVLKEDVFIREELKDSCIELMNDESERIEHRGSAMTICYNIDEGEEAYINSLIDLASERNLEEIRYKALGFLSQIRARPNDKHIDKIKEISANVDEPEGIRQLALKSYDNLVKLEKVEATPPVNKYKSLALIVVLVVIVAVLGFVLKKKKRV